MPLVTFKDLSKKKKTFDFNRKKTFDEPKATKNNYEESRAIKSHYKEEIGRQEKKATPNVYFKKDKKEKRQNLGLLFKEYAKINHSTTLNNLQIEIINYVDKLFTLSKDKNAYSQLDQITDKFRHYSSHYLNDSIKQLVNFKIIHLINDIKTNEVKCRLSTDLVLKKAEFEDEYTRPWKPRNQSSSRRSTFKR